MTILKVYIRNQPLTGSKIITNKDGNPLNAFDITAIDLLYVDHGDTVQIIKNAYGPIGVYSKVVFEDEFNVPELTREEAEIF